MSINLSNVVLDEDLHSAMHSALPFYRHSPYRYLRYRCVHVEADAPRGRITVCPRGCITVCHGHGGGWTVVQGLARHPDPASRT